MKHLRHLLLGAALLLAQHQHHHHSAVRPVFHPAVAAA